MTKICEEQSRLFSLLQELGATPSPAEGNAVLAHFKNASWVCDALAGLGIAVRPFVDNAMSSTGETVSSLRIICPGESKAYTHIEHALRCALRPEALLLDMDGVLADVSSSYRKAILLSAEAFGVKLLPTEISLAKAEGSSNNDWELTHRLLRIRGVNVSLAEVIECFENLYQGRDPRSGLRNTERLTVDSSWVKRLAGEISLGVVTGRPRADARRFLKEVGIVDWITTLVCMEDAPLKPSPEPITLALKKLGCKRAWMVGDTPDDIRASARAGVIPLGVVAPGEDREQVSPILIEAGAARVLERLEAVEALLE